MKKKEIDLKKGIFERKRLFFVHFFVNRGNHKMEI